MDAQISSDAEGQNSDYLNNPNWNYGQDCLGRFPRSFEDSHCSSQNLDIGGLNLDIKQEQVDRLSFLHEFYFGDQGRFPKSFEDSHCSSQNVDTEGLNLDIKQEQADRLSFLHEFYFGDQDNPLEADEDELASFLWPSYLKNEQFHPENGSGVNTEDDGSREQSQFSEIQKSEYPRMLPKDLKYTHKEILEQCQRKNYTKQLRRKRYRKNSTDGKDCLQVKKELQSNPSLKSLPEGLKYYENRQNMSNNNNCKDIDSWSKEKNWSEKRQSDSMDFRHETSGNLNSSLKLIKKCYVNIKKFNCSDCSYGTSFRGSFVYLCEKHKNIKLFKCDYCDFETNYKRDSVKHNLKCRSFFLKNLQTSLSKCSNSINVMVGNYHSLPLLEIITLLCQKYKSQELNTSDQISSDVLKCSKCIFETGNRKIFNLHSQIHIEVKKCPECNFENKNTETFKCHLVYHLYHFKGENIYNAHGAKHENNKFKCDDCDFESNYKSFLIRHNLDSCHKKKELNSKQNCNTIKQSRVNKCPECSFESEDTEIFKYHLVNHFKGENIENTHGAKHENNKLFKCDDCDFESGYKDCLIRHNLNGCPKKKELNSKQNCNIVRRPRFAKHILLISDIMFLVYNIKKSCYKNPSVPSTSEPFKCSECSFETKNQKFLEFHSQIHSGVLECPACSYGSTDTETFKNHLITHLYQSTSMRKSAPGSFGKRSRHSNKTVLEELSDEGNREMSERHSSDFEDEMSDIEEDTLDNDQLESFRCLECSFETENVKIFNIHLQIHVEIKKCTECNFETKDVDTLRVHLINHFK